MCADSITARQPAMLAIEDGTSIDGPREMCGTASVASAVMGRRASASTRSGSKAGARGLIGVAPGGASS